MAEAREYHRPVLLREVVECLGPAPGRRFVDGTLGGGGHARALLEAGAEVIAIDRDPDAIEHAARELSRFGDRIRLMRSDFRRVGEVLRELEVGPVDGLLLDLGVSSWQLDSPGRGFSFQAEGPLDMRMDPGVGEPASVWVNGRSEAELAELFRDLGEEPAARRIAAAVVRRRAAAPIRTTAELAAVVESVAPRRGRTHPATRVFQALRMAVNDELGALREVLEAAPGVLAPGGRLTVIAFHSLEDRVVKRFLRETSALFLDRPEWPAPRPNPRRFFRLPVRGVLEPSEDEVRANPRARSARLRVAERMD